MQGKSASLQILVFVLLGLIMFNCTNKDKTAVNPLYPVSSYSTSTGGNFTIPSSNFTNSTLGSVTLYSLSLPSSSFSSSGVNCSLGLRGYVMTMVSPNSQLAYTRLTFKSQPTSGGTYTFVSEESAPLLTENTVWASIIDIRGKKEWRAKSGKLNVNILGDGSIEASLDTAFIEGYPNTTDTSYYYMLGKLYCK